MSRQFETPFEKPIESLTTREVPRDLAPPAAEFSLQQRRLLLRIAHEAILSVLERQTPPEAPPLTGQFERNSRLAGTQHTEKQFPGQESPASWGDENDRFAHVRGGLLDRWTRSHTCPKMDIRGVLSFLPHRQHSQ